MVLVVKLLLLKLEQMESEAAWSNYLDIAAFQRKKSFWEIFPIFPNFSQFLAFFYESNAGKYCWKPFLENIVFYSKYKLKDTLSLISCDIPFGELRASPV